MPPGTSDLNAIFAQIFESFSEFHYDRYFLSAQISTERIVSNIRTTIALNLCKKITKGGLVSIPYFRMYLFDFCVTDFNNSSLKITQIIYFIKIKHDN